jgi:hypothetical protein
MAETIPDTLPASSTAGEKRVFAALARLPDDCLIYYEPVVRRRYPDRITILPEVGVLVIEVKDWRLAEVSSVTPDTVAVTRRGVASLVPHPRQQARGYMLRLMDECRRHPLASLLMRTEGRYAGSYAFPFCHIAVLSNINRSQIEREAPELSRLFPPTTTITRDELATWHVLEPQALLARLKASFDPWWPFPKLTPAPIDIFRSVIHPEVVIRAHQMGRAARPLHAPGKYPAPPSIDASRRQLHHASGHDPADWQCKLKDGPARREGTRGALVSRFAALRVRPSHRYYWRAEPWPQEWLLIEWPEGEKEPTRYWLSTLPADTPIATLVDTAKLRWRIERDFQDLKQEIGLDHYEGRGWRGFHHHAALSIAAYGFLVAERSPFSPLSARPQSPRGDRP